MNLEQYAKKIANLSGHKPDVAYQVLSAELTYILLMLASDQPLATFFGTFTRNDDGTVNIEPSDDLLRFMKGRITTAEIAKEFLIR